MNAIKYFHNRFSYAIKTNGTIKVNQQDIEAINKLIEKEEKRNTDLEDSLLLFYIFWMYTIENENNKLEIKEKGIERVKFPLGLNTPYNLLNHLSKLLNPKSYMIKKIHEQIWIYQEYERVHRNQELYKSEVYENQKFIKEGDFSYLKATIQETEPIPKEEFISYDEVKQLLNDTLKKAKEEFPKFKYLKDELWKD